MTFFQFFDIRALQLSNGTIGSISERIRTSKCVVSGEIVNPGELLSPNFAADEVHFFHSRSSNSKQLNFFLEKINASGRSVQDILERGGATPPEKREVEPQEIEEINNHGEEKFQYLTLSQVINPLLFFPLQIAYVSSAKDSRITNG